MKLRGNTVQQYEVKYRLHANEMQICVSPCPGSKANVFSSLDSLEHCIADIWRSTTNNLLKLNEDKSNIVYLASLHYS